MRYSPGEFLNALNPESAIRNENTWIGLEEEAPPHRRLVVRQISGAIARRIVCDLRPGEVLARGQKFGMIKLGSRTELIIPDTRRSDDRSRHWPDDPGGNDRHGEIWEKGKAEGEGEDDSAKRSGAGLPRIVGLDVP